MIRLKPTPHSIDFTLDMILKTERVPGDVVELGSYQGAGLITIASFLEEIGSARNVVGFDSFAGLETTAADGHQFRGRFSDTSLPSLLGKIERYGLTHRTRLVPGDICETILEFGNPVSLVVFDCDLYEPYVAGLSKLWPQLALSGAIIFDEYGRPDKWPGAKQATDEFFSSMQMSHWMKPRHADDFNWPAAPRWYVRKERVDPPHP